MIQFLMEHETQGMVWVVALTEADLELLKTRLAVLSGGHINFPGMTLVMFGGKENQQIVKDAAAYLGA